MSPINRFWRWIISFEPSCVCSGLKSVMLVVFFTVTKSSPRTPDLKQGIPEYIFSSDHIAISECNHDYWERSRTLEGLFLQCQMFQLPP